jgi:hypothetical protein
MSKAFTSAVVLCFLLMLYCRQARAQSAADTSADLDRVKETFAVNFNKNVGPQSQLFNGKELTYYDPTIKGNAWFMDKRDWSAGSVFYDGYFYNNVQLIYDLYKDRVALLLNNKVTGVILLSERVKNFTLLNHTFIYVKHDSLSRKTVETGFYDELYGGKIKLLARREKSIQTASTATSTESYFSSTVDYYLFKNGDYFPVSSKSSVLDILKDHKRELQQFISQNDLQFNKTGREDAMVKVAEYYDHLTK